MPSIAEAIAFNRQRISQGGITGAVPVETPAAPSPSVPAPPEAYPNMPSRGVWPASLILATDTTDGSQIFQKNAVRSRSFPYPPAIAQINKTVVQATTAAAVSTSIKLETNNIANPSQSVLNLIAGTNITLISTVDGSVTISSTSSGDGLVHGETPWESDPAYVSFRDDFMYQDAGTGGGYGDLKWSLVGTVGGHRQVTGRAPHIGMLDWFNGTTANTGGFLQIGDSSITKQDIGYIDVGNPSWKMELIFQFTPLITGAPPAASFAKKTIYLGIMDVVSASATWPARPYCFVGLRYDTDTTAPAISDTTFKFEVVENAVGAAGGTRNNTQGTVVDTGLAPVSYQWYKLTITCLSAGSVTLTLLPDGGTAVSKTMTVPKYTANDASTTGQIGVAGGVGQLGAGSSVNFPWGSGAQVTISNLVPAAAAYDGTYVLYDNNQPTQFHFAATGTLGATSTTYTVVGYPSFVPCILFGNDTEATPASNLTFWIDYFSFVWNPGVNPNNSLTPTATKVRYF